MSKAMRSYAYLFFFTLELKFIGAFLIFFIKALFNKE